MNRRPLNINHRVAFIVNDGVSEIDGMEIHGSYDPCELQGVVLRLHDDYVLVATEIGDVWVSRPNLFI